MTGEHDDYETVEGIDTTEIELEDASDHVPNSLPILPLKDTVVFPETVLPLAVGQDRSVRLVDDALVKDKLVGLVAIKNGEAELAGPDDLHSVGVMAVIHKMMRMPDGTLRVLVQGLRRFRTTDYLSEEPYLEARVEPVDDLIEDTKELQALTHQVSSLFSRLLAFFPSFPEELQVALANIDSPVSLAHLVASTLRIKTEEKQSLLEEVDVEERMLRLVSILTRELDVFELGDKIQSEVKSQMDKSQREYFLRQQMKAIQDELGETDETASEVNELRQKLEDAGLPEEAKKQAERELDRLAKMPPMAAEWSVIRSYLDWVTTLPWNVSTEDNLDIEGAKQVLDEDHYDLEKIKERILEFLSVRKVKDQMTGPILCFVGPPGVGKTSLGQSIARALGRKFIRISVGGVRDEAEIRGHRRTYVGALPGTILRAIRDSGANNPVFMMDEVDKIGADYFRGDPASALLEVLDPEQNHSFRDHYLDLPFDLSKVLFITTANVLDPVPPALRDRMEVIHLSGYTEEEKLSIARKYLIPKQVSANGLKPEDIEFSDRAILDIAKYYTKEAGLRNLERNIGSICRKMVRKVAEGESGPFHIEEYNIEELLGRHKFLPEVKRRTSVPGVATGLAWTGGGGDILFIESASMPGSGRLTITGQLGSVMKESAEAAMSYTRSMSHRLNVANDFFKKHDMHIHVPAGAVPKDGPSAGVTLATSIISLITDKPVDSETAMTGEITLTGQVLPVGGIKEKVLAARRAGITKIILPSINQKDVEEDVPEDQRANIEMIYVERIEEVIEAALGLPLTAPHLAAAAV